MKRQRVSASELTCIQVPSQHLLLSFRGEMLAPPRFMPSQPAGLELFIHPGRAQTAKDPFHRIHQPPKPLCSWRALFPGSASC